MMLCYVVERVLTGALDIDLFSGESSVGCVKHSFITIPLRGLMVCDKEVDVPDAIDPFSLCKRSRLRHQDRGVVLAIEAECRHPPPWRIGVVVVVGLDSNARSCSTNSSIEEHL